jgi:hypothetical protein
MDTGTLDFGYVVEGWEAPGGEYLARARTLEGAKIIAAGTNAIVRDALTGKTVAIVRDLNENA